MARPTTTALFAFVLLAASSLVGCGSSERANESVSASANQPLLQRSSPPPASRPQNTKRLGARDLLDQLASAGLTTQDLGPAQLDIDDTSRFPEEARSTMVLRISDGQGNSEAMTFIEFGSWKAAAALDAKPINGFAVRNWFVRGIVSNYFVDLVTEALAD